MPLSEETKKKISLAKKGVRQADWVVEKKSESYKGNVVVLNASRRNLLIAQESNKGRPHSAERRQKESEGAKRRYQNIDERIKAGLRQKGEKAHNWKGGVTPSNRSIRHSLEFKLWREAVFVRDNWTCQKCGRQGGMLHPHHIKPFATYLELRFAIDNGITYCKRCHMEEHSKLKEVSNV